MQADTVLDESFLTTASPWNIPVRVLPVTTSSNDELLSLGETGSPTGTLLFAERQTAGRGQFRRVWASAQPLGLWFSLLLRLEISDTTIPALSSFASVALVETLDELGIREARIKPPNDLYLHGRKMAGILVETRTGKHPFAVVGIGLNVNHRLEDFPPELLKSATSLLIASGQRFNRNHVAGVLLKALGRSEELLRDNPAALLAVWNNLLIPDPEIRQD